MLVSPSPVGLPLVPPPLWSRAVPLRVVRLAVGGRVCLPSSLPLGHRHGAWVGELGTVGYSIVVGAIFVVRLSSGDHGGLRAGELGAVGYLVVVFPRFGLSAAVG